MTRTVILIFSAAVGLLISFSAAADSRTNDAGHALAQRFIDGPAAESAFGNTRSESRPGLQEHRSKEARRKMEGERRRELQALTEKLRRSREALLRRQSAFSNNSARRASNTSINSINRTDPPAARPSSRVAILLLLHPSRRSSPRFARTADPIICLSRRCYISNGPVAPARKLRRGRALGPFNSIGQRAGACQDQTQCIFRRVALDTPNAMVQPIDLGWIRHDRRRAHHAAADTTCTIKAGSLTCLNAIETSNYRMWVVPETVARRAGSRMLLSALSSGLTPNPVHAHALVDTALQPTNSAR